MKLRQHFLCSTFVPAMDIADILWEQFACNDLRSILEITIIKWFTVKQIDNRLLRSFSVLNPIVNAKAQYSKGKHTSCFLSIVTKHKQVGVVTTNKIHVHVIRHTKRLTNVKTSRNRAAVWLIGSKLIEDAVLIIFDIRQKNASRLICIRNSPVADFLQHVSVLFRCDICNSEMAVILLVSGFGVVNGTTRIINGNLINFSAAIIQQQVRICFGAFKYNSYCHLVEYSSVNTCDIGIALRS